jgi:hypothetical protein
MIERVKPSAELVLRFQVEVGNQDAFLRRMSAVVERDDVQQLLRPGPLPEAAAKPEATEAPQAGDARVDAPAEDDTGIVRLLQPLIGRDPLEWELRVALPSMARLGSVIDKSGSLFALLAELPASGPVDAGSPVYRVWTLPVLRDGPGAESTDTLVH